MSTTVTTVYYITIMSIKHCQMSLVITIYWIFAAKISLIYSQSQSNQMCCSISQLSQFSSRLSSAFTKQRFSYLYLLVKFRYLSGKGYKPTSAMVPLYHDALAMGDAMEHKHDVNHLAIAASLVSKTQKTLLPLQHGTCVHALHMFQHHHGRNREAVANFKTTSLVWFSG